MSPAAAVDERGYGGVMADEGSPAVSGARHMSFGPIEIDVGSIGDARLKRLVYPPGMRWSVDVKPLVGTDLCEHAHAGFLIEGELRFEFLHPGPEALVFVGEITSVCYAADDVVDW